MEKKEQMYEGKAKKVFATDNPDLVIVDYKDDATAFNGLKKGTIAGKGVINNKMSNNDVPFNGEEGDSHPLRGGNFRSGNDREEGSDRYLWR